MKYLNNDAKQKFEKVIDINKNDGYGRATINFTIRWANLMEEEVAKGKKVFEIADSTSHKADTEGITGFMYNYAVKLLSECWLYGEDLRKWHNKEYNYEGNGVVNSCILSV